MKEELKNVLRSATTVALVLCLGLAAGVVRVPAQGGDLSGGVGAFAAQPKPNKVVEKIKRPVYKRPAGPTVSPNDRLMEAASTGNVAAFAALLKGGASVNAKARAGGCTPLVYAVEGKQKAAARELLAKGADVNLACEDGLTALMLASEDGDAELAQLFIDGGANVNAKTSDGRTALIFASSSGHLSVVRPLLAKGADAAARFKDGRTPIVFAAANGHAPVVEELREGWRGRERAARRRLDAAALGRLVRAHGRRQVPAR